MSVLRTVDAFDLLPAAVRDAAVRAVEDAVCANFTARGDFTGEQGPAVVRALLDLGWTAPAVSAP